MDICVWVGKCRSSGFGIFFFHDFSDNLQARILDWKEKGRAWVVNLVQLHPDNCAHTRRLGIAMQAFENTKKKLLIYISYYCEGIALLLKITLYLHFFEARATWLFTGSLSELMCHQGLSPTSKSSWDPGMNGHHYLPHTHFSGSSSFVYSLLKENLSATLFRLQINWFSFPFNNLYF